MHLTAAHLAQILGGTLEGNPHVIVTKPARIEEAQAGDLAFLDNPKYEAFAYTTHASVLLVNRLFQPTQPISATLIRVEDVRSSLAQLLELFQHSPSSNGTASQIDPLAWIHAEATIGESTAVGPFVVVEAGSVIGEHCVIHPHAYIGRQVRIGRHCTIHAGVRILHGCIIGDHCVVYPNAVIGSDGFGFALQEDGSWKRIPHVGNVVVESYVEIGANACIDRAAIGSTLIRTGVKIDNLVHIAHNVEVGKNTAMAAQVGVAGSSKIGENVQLGGQVGVAGHLTLANGTRVQAQSGVASSVHQPNQALFGSPAIPYNDYVRAYVVFKKLPELQRKIDQLERLLQEHLHSLKSEDRGA